MSGGSAVREVPASLAQRMLWMLDHHRSRNGCLNYPLLLGLTGALDPSVLARSINALVARHEALRTTFERRRGRLYQLIHPARPVELSHRGTVPPHLLDRLVDQEAHTPVDPRRECVRATVWSVAPTEHVLCLNVHHLNTDAWSCQVLVRELARLLAGHDDLPLPAWQFRHAVEWRRRQVRADEDARKYWTRQLAGASPVPLRGGRPPTDTRTAALPVALGPDDLATLRRLAHRERTTMFAVLAAAMAIALSRSSGTTDVCFASPFANRLRAETMGTVGMLANLAVVRVPVPPSAGLAAVIPRATRALEEARPHQHFPYVSLPAIHAAGRLDDVILQLLPSLPDDFDCGSVRMRVLPPRLTSRFPLEMSLVASGDALIGTLQYLTGAVDESMAGHVVETFVGAIRSSSGPAAARRDPQDTAR